MRKPLGKIYLLLLLVAGLLLVRGFLPVFIKRFANQYLRDFSPVIAGEIKDVDLSILRGSYRIQGMSVWLKREKKEILTVQESKISLAWSELLKGKVLLTVEAEKVSIHFSRSILAELKKLNKKEVESAKEKALPLDLERFQVRDGTIVFEDFKSLNSKGAFKIRELEASLTNVTAQESFPLSFFSVTAIIGKEAPLKLAGKIDLVKKPVRWDLDGTLQNFNLKEANPMLKDKVPITFVHGEADLYAEAKSEGGVIEGYMKPFLKELNVLRSDEDFKSAQHWGIEVVTAITNILMKNTDKNSLATRIPFRLGKGIHVDTGEAIEKAIQHGYESRLRPGLENKYNLE